MSMIPPRPKNTSLCKLGSESQVQDQALEWLLRLTSGRVTEQEANAFRRWCAHSEEHRKAFARIKRVWDLLGKAAEHMAEPESTQTIFTAFRGIKKL